MGTLAEQFRNATALIVGLYSAVRNQAEPHHFTM